MTYIESLEFLMQSLAIKIDDELMVYLLRFKSAIEEDGRILKFGSGIHGSKIHPMFLQNNA